MVKSFVTFRCRLHMEAQGSDILPEKGCQTRWDKVSTPPVALSEVV